jgi:hypothetical protein
MKEAVRVARMGAIRKTHKTIVGKPGGNKPLGESRRGDEDNIKTDVRTKGSRKN